jgi:hypothetical protein
VVVERVPSRRPLAGKTNVGSKPTVAGQGLTGKRVGR